MSPAGCAAQSAEPAASLLGPSICSTLPVIGLPGRPPIARIVRGLFLALREREFLLAGRTIGASNRRLIFRHIPPNAAAPAIVAATSGMASAILLEAGLRFLGLGVRPPTPTWGNMLTDARSLTVLEPRPWLWIPPGVMIAPAVLSINFIGDGLRDARPASPAVSSPARDAVAAVCCGSAAG